MVHLRPVSGPSGPLWLEQCETDDGERGSGQNQGEPWDGGELITPSCMQYE